MYLQFHSVKEPSKNRDIWVRVLFDSWQNLGFGSVRSCWVKFFPISNFSHALVFLLYKPVSRRDGVKWSSVRVCVCMLQLLSVLENTVSKLARYDQSSLFSSILTLTVSLFSVCVQCSVSFGACHPVDLSHIERSVADYLPRYTTLQTRG